MALSSSLKSPVTETMTIFALVQLQFETSLSVVGLHPSMHIALANPGAYSIKLYWS
jgi:hypothetical protein